MNGLFPIGGLGYSTIEFNSNYHLNCTKAHIAATLLHESMHAYIEVQKVALTPAGFAARYPIFSTGFDNNNSHHRVIADEYIDELSQSLHSMFPDLTDEFVEALTWQGLQGTPAYAALIASQPAGFEARLNQINRIASCGIPSYPHELESMGLEPCL
jgi:hypothetical protein